MSLLGCCGHATWLLLVVTAEAASVLLEPQQVTSGPPLYLNSTAVLYTPHTPVTDMKEGQQSPVQQGIDCECCMSAEAAAATPVIWATQLLRSMWQRCERPSYSITLVAISDEPCLTVVVSPTEQLAATILASFINHVWCVSQWTTHLLVVPCRLLKVMLGCRLTIQQ